MQEHDDAEDDNPWRDIDVGTTGSGPHFALNPGPTRMDVANGPAHVETGTQAQCFEARLASNVDFPPLGTETATKTAGNFVPARRCG